MTRTIPLHRGEDESDNARLMAEARAALDALLARATRKDSRFFGRVAVEVTIQNGHLGHVKEILERTRK